MTVQTSEVVATVGADQWSYVWAAYGLTFVLAALVIAFSYAAMRRAEAKADAMKRNRD